MSEITAALKVSDFHKTFRTDFYKKKVQAVRGVSFVVQPGEIFGLLGPNGAGKTTLMKTAMGLLFPTSGSIEVFGHSQNKAAARQSVGYLPENPYFHEYLNPKELLDFYGVLGGLSRSQIRERRDELLERVGLAEAAGRPLRKFSKGMLQRVGLAQAMIAKPSLMVLDEPMTGLDPIGRKFVSDLIQTLNAEGTTIIFSSHILSDVERLCNRVVILNRGKLVAEGQIADLIADETGAATLESIFVRHALQTSDTD